MSSITKCNVCDRIDIEPLEIGEVTFSVSRYDHDGYFDTMDICSAACLARLAVDNAHLLGTMVGRIEASVAIRPEPTKRKWWNR